MANERVAKPTDSPTCLGEVQGARIHLGAHER
ncbi:hypothetical protein COLO4_00635 [Corchorus olitorius]|uniref:Uncharacterized protein n=1 Tax=Corchorus olitorius TaxID=93759 RepID=A0A1R3L3N3_9ROSI|nr:hypothetical protein COLO4_00635 [Corchorus olitorius]